MGWTKRWSRRLRALVRREAVEQELDEELAFHLEMETQKNLRQGMSPEEARRQAAIAFGGIERHKEEVRDARWLSWAGGLSLDLRLGVRMLAKHPGLTLVGGVGMAVAIAIGAVFDVAAAVMQATLPLDEGERVVALEMWDQEINNQERRFLHDFVTWREELESVEELGAYRMVSRNLVIPGGTTEPVTVAEMTASGFRLARTAPVLGRALLPEDEQPGAPAVVVLGHEVWRTRFQSDPSVVGREVRLGAEVHTVVGVMPEGFAFPMNHKLWIPFRQDPSQHERRDGPAIYAFGRLAPGATLAEAQAELSTLGLAAATAFPETHQRLRPRVVPYTQQLWDDGEALLLPLGRLLLTLLLVVICVNVAVLVYARTANRRGEITVRSALGASRRRIVGQLFAEALVLAGVAAAVGLAIAVAVVRRLDSLAATMGSHMGGLPYWLDLQLSPRTVLYVVGLAALAAAIVGVLPALQATGRRLQADIRQLGGGTGMRMGRTWTVLIVAQVAFAVAALPGALFYGWDMVRYGLLDPGFPAERYLAATLVMDRDIPPSAEVAAYEREFDARYRDRVSELAARLRSEPGLAAVTFALDFPGQEPTVRVEVDGPALPPGSARGHAAGANRVDPGFFDAFAVPVLAGRGFGAADLGDGATAVVVNQSFARRVLGEQSPVGRRIRYAEGYRAGGVMQTPDGVELDHWYEIVGVVGDLPAHALEPDETPARLYHPLRPGQAHPVRMALHTRGTEPAAFAPRLRALATELDPTIQLRQVRPLDEVLGELQTGLRLGGLALGLISLSVLLLSAAGIYALMSFTVTQRRREIGIRSALGAHPRRVLGSIFSRAASQLALGALLGLVVAVLLDRATGGELTGGQPALVLAAVAALMLGVGMLAAIGPARRGLRIQPMEALREE